ncbi:Uncharacterised protein [Vibrio cholerae]|nr:Uncharacterised protein [Vibrio cholerae]CSI56977.1 Uncharacterised protein [Vibrio cholerae]
MPVITALWFIRAAASRLCRNEEISYSKAGIAASGQMITSASQFSRVRSVYFMMVGQRWLGSHFNPCSILP